MTTLVVASILAALAAPADRGALRRAPSPRRPRRGPGQRDLQRRADGAEQLARGLLAAALHLRQVAEAHPRASDTSRRVRPCDVRARRSTSPITSRSNAPSCSPSSCVAGFLVLGQRCATAADGSRMTQITAARPPPAAAAPPATRIPIVHPAAAVQRPHGRGVRRAPRSVATGASARRLESGSTRPARPQ